MAAPKWIGRKWRIIGSILVAGKRVKMIRKTVTIASETALDEAEKQMRDHMSKVAFDIFSQQDLKELTIEVETEIE